MGDTPKVVIFGAGVTGLTVAHELVERGWDVTVVEKEIDPLNVDECAIGGLAKTQWAVYQAPVAAAARDRARERIQQEAKDALKVVADGLAAPLAAPGGGGAEATTELALSIVQKAEEAAKKAREAAKKVRNLTDRSNLEVASEVLPLVPTARVRINPSAEEKFSDLQPKAANIVADTKLREGLIALGLQQEEPLERGIEALGATLHDILDIGSQFYLARVVDRLRAIAPFTPTLRIVAQDVGEAAARGFAECLRLFLLGQGAGVVDIAQAEQPLPKGVWQIETALLDRPSGDVNLPNRPEDFSGILPGEHGFRFFPALYRHLFDTLRRIPVRGEDQSFSDVYRTVYDNLVPTESNWLAVTDSSARRDSNKAKERGVVRFPRRLRKSLREVLDAMSEMQTELGYTARDVELLKLRLFKYMTSCTDRRNKQYESMRWSDFMGLSDLSKAAQQDMIRAPQLLAAMTATESDARTQGNLATQLLLDPINADERVDSTLNGPTSVAWFIPWKDYLVSQGVQFVPGALVGFKSEGAGPEATIRPVLEDSARFGVTPVKVGAADYYVLALPVQAWSEPTNGKTLVDIWNEERVKVGANEDHVLRLGKWIANHVRPEKDGSGDLYKGLTGIQLYFDTDRLSRSGHTLFMDSTWRLCAISQASFWSRRRDAFDGYRGIVSVDIGSLLDGNGKAEGERNEIKPFWTTPRDKVHEVVWRQIRQGYGDFKFDGSDLAPYRMYRIDEYIEYGGSDKLPKRNLAPFLINGIGEWDDRSGWDTVGDAEPGQALAEEHSPARYQLMPKYDDKKEESVKGARWVLAGTFLQTWTRATTMESANESARHAVNTLLESASKRFNRQAEMCRIWNPEMYEHPDLKVWRELDQRLYDWDEEPLPHMFDILELDGIPDALTEKGEMSETLRLLTSRVVEKGQNK